LQTWVIFRRVQARERILMVWNRSGEEVEVAIPAVGDQATLYDIAGHSGPVTPSEGGYRLILPPATNRNHAFLPPPEDYAIGGAPYILVEHEPVPAPRQVFERIAPPERR
jgi:hypothetical protein